MKFGNDTNCCSIWSIYFFWVFFLFVFQCLKCFLQQKSAIWYFRSKWNIERGTKELEHFKHFIEGLHLISEWRRIFLSAWLTLMLFHTEFCQIFCFFFWWKFRFYILLWNGIYFFERWNPDDICEIRLEFDLRFEVFFLFYFSWRMFFWLLSFGWWWMFDLIMWNWLWIGWCLCWFLFASCFARVGLLVDVDVLLSLKVCTHKLFVFIAIHLWP